MPILASLLIAASAVSAPALGVWPEQTGPAASIVDGIEFYLVEPEDSFGIIAIQPLPTPLRAAEPAAVRRLAGVARRLGADGVVLLGELVEEAIPDDVSTALPAAKRYGFAVFVSFDQQDVGDGESSSPATIVRGNSPRSQVTGTERLKGRR